MLFHPDPDGSGSAASPIRGLPLLLLPSAPPGTALPLLSPCHSCFGHRVLPNADPEIASLGDATKAAVALLAEIQSRIFLPLLSLIFPYPPLFFKGNLCRQLQDEQRMGGKYIKISIPSFRYFKL